MFSLIFIVSLLYFGALIRDCNTPKIIQGTSFVPNSVSVNLTESDTSELQLVGSLREKNGITLLGSSELTSESEKISYKFLPDSLGIRLNAFGHAHHQSFAMFCQLLALKKDLKGAKICILLSPGWFETEGTNIEAFLEFVKPNFMSNIIKDQSIPTQYKDRITSFLIKNEKLIDNPNSSLYYFLNKEKYKSIPFLNTFFTDRYSEFPSVDYELKINKKYTNSINRTINWEINKINAQQNFLLKSNSNNIFVSNTYFNAHLRQKNGNFKKGKYLCLSPNKSQELDDFKLLIELLKNEGSDVSVVIQTLNPYYYDNLESFIPVLNEVELLLKQKNIPYLNFYSPKKEKYKPGTLDDVMHLGDLGWIEVNEFIYKNYYAK